MYRIVGLPFVEAKPISFIINKNIITSSKITVHNLRTQQ